MTTPTEIELPCGVVLTTLDGGSWPKWRCVLASLCFEIADLSERVGHESWWAGTSLQGALGGTTVASRAEAISWLNARVLELRAALAPKDARETVASAIARTPGWNPIEGLRPGLVAFAMADAALAALGLRGAS